MAVLPGSWQLPSRVCASATKQWNHIYALGLNMGNLPGLHGSRIKCLSFEKRLPWGRGFYFFKSYIYLQDKGYLHKLQAFVELLRMVVGPFSWCSGLQEAGKCTSECFRVLCFLKHSQVRSIQMPYISQVFSSDLSSYSIYSNIFIFFFLARS